MDLKVYQREAVDEIMNNIGNYEKLRVVIPIGLVRNPIIVRIALNYIDF